MTSTPSTAYSRDLGDELRRLRETCTDLSGVLLAEKLGWHPSKVSTIEHGKAKASEIDLVQYLTMCGKDIDFFVEFKRRYQYAFDEYVVRVSGNLRTVAMAESTATTITSYSPQSVPGLLQTPEYADGIYRMTGMVTRGAHSDPRPSSAPSARRSCGDTIGRLACSSSMSVRCSCRSETAGSWRTSTPGCCSRRIPSGSCPRTRRWPATGCVLWEYDKARPVVFSETNLAKVFVQDPGAIARTRLLFNRLDEVALDEEQSRSRLAEYVSRPREELDDSGPRMA